MRSKRRPLCSRLLLSVPLLLAGACGPQHAGPGTSQFVPLQCGQGTGASAGREIGEGGGTVAVRGHSLTLPPGAMAASTRFSITELDTSYIAVEVAPSATPFRRNATLTLSYARCGGNPGLRNLTILEVRSGTTHVLRALPSVVDSAAQTVSTAELDHLSGYLIGGNREDGGTDE